MSRAALLQRAQQFGLMFAAWTFLAIVQACQWYFAYAARHVSFRYEISYTLKEEWVYAALTPFVLWLASRYPFGQHKVLPTLAVHLFGLAVFLTLFALIRMPLGQIPDLTTGHSGHPSWSLYRSMWFRYVYDTIWTYGGIVALHELWIYYGKYRERELRASRLEGQLAQAQLKVLKMQLDPHFLFNTLHSISSLMHEDVEAADDVLARLSDLLRMSLEDVNEQEVTLKREIEFLDGYLAIQQIRFRDRFVVRVNIDPKSLDALVPNMILQPLVENAVRHGIASRAGAGHLDVRSAVEDGVVRLEVLDDGPGPGDDFLDGPGGGVGLANTRARLQQLYGNAFRFSLSRPGRGGTLVALEIPYRLKMEPRESSLSAAPR